MTDNKLTLSFDNVKDDKYAKDYNNENQNNNHNDSDDQTKIGTFCHIWKAFW